jgi:hypothetical protein
VIEAVGAALLLQVVNVQIGLAAQGFDRLIQECTGFVGVVLIFSLIVFSLIFFVIPGS